MGALSRALLRLAYGLPPDPRDGEELGRIFDATTFHGVDAGNEHDKTCPNG